MRGVGVPKSFNRTDPTIPTIYFLMLYFTIGRPSKTFCTNPSIKCGVYLKRICIVILSSNSDYFLHHFVKLLINNFKYNFSDATGLIGQLRSFEKSLKKTFVESSHTEGTAAPWRWQGTRVRRHGGFHRWICHHIRVFHNWICHDNLNLSH